MIFFLLALPEWRLRGARLVVFTFSASLDKLFNVFTLYIIYIVKASGR
jgi:hypothetical protein